MMGGFGTATWKKSFVVPLVFAGLCVCVRFTSFSQVFPQFRQFLLAIFELKL